MNEDLFAIFFVVLLNTVITEIGMLCVCDHLKKIKNLLENKYTEGK